MNMGDVKKVQAAGFRVFMFDIIKKAIYENTGNGSWKLYDKYETKAEAEREWKKLMDSPKCIGG